MDWYQQVFKFFVLPLRGRVAALQRGFANTLLVKYLPAYD